MKDFQVHRCVCGADARFTHACTPEDDVLVKCLAAIDTSIVSRSLHSEVEVPNESWLGIHKVQEEMGELGTVLGKLCVVPNGKHWDEGDGAKSLRERLKEEIADVYAALDYFVSTNVTQSEGVEISVRRAIKLDRFRNWILTGVKESNVTEKT